MTYDEYLDKQRKDEDCGDPIRAAAYLEFDGIGEMPDPRSLLKGWIRFVWMHGYRYGFRRGFEAGQGEKP